VRPIDDNERRARLVVRHHLVHQQHDPVAVARDLIAIHATDPATVFLSLAARTRDVSVADVERTLYDDRTLVRVLCMRRTIFVIPIELLPMIHAAATTTVGSRERKKLVDLLETSGIAKDGRRWLRTTEQATMRALTELGEAAATELVAKVPALRATFTYGDGTKQWHGEQGVSTRVLWTLANDGRIARGRPRGTWLSTQHRWAPMEAWLPDGIAPMDAATARAALVRRWLGTFGPGTRDDIRWWTGWSTAHVDAALASNDTEVVGLDGGGTGFVLADDVDPAPKAPPSVALLPALDSTAMGWNDRGWYVGPHAPALFDRSGNVGPTVWCDGRIVGGWGQRATGEIAYRLLEPVPKRAATAIDREAARLREWIGAARVKPRFRTPIDVDLSA
jgi:hypothetical protein